MSEREELLIKRRRKGISQKFLSEKLNCNQSLISRWEKNQCNMSDEKISKYREIIEFQ
ncbi:helix-turn-helix domain-containing protein [Lentibacillus amyloliquefaciens]|uniref:XRE family transcriptional regulator n=1 Tax=Lentibacillus amyloliquefaciens TaxID=1472767 RepID=A0A0U4F501_9BACI|nr:helix-turn-helix transcriptional regulator [Lentibacillus amyloliquefaciens]ALX47859.1 XRE family transcriptional regulator [Lentibacillus amyloliquefaciens]